MDDLFERAFQRGWRFRLKAIELRAAAADDAIPESLRETLLRTADGWDASAALAERRCERVRSV